MLQNVNPYWETLKCPSVHVKKNKSASGVNVLVFNDQLETKEIPHKCETALEITGVVSLAS